MKHVIVVGAVREPPGVTNRPGSRTARGREPNGVANQTYSRYYSNDIIGRIPMRPYDDDEDKPWAKNMN